MYLFLRIKNGTKAAALPRRVPEQLQIRVGYVRSEKSQLPWENGQVKIKHSYCLQYIFTFPGVIHFSNKYQRSLKFSLCDF